MLATESTRSTNPHTAAPLWHWPLAAALALLVSACGGSSGDAATPAPAAATGTVVGTVAAAGGAALAGVAVTSAGRSASTAADGSFTLADVPAGDRTVVAFELAGHAKGLLTIAVAGGATTSANARLTRVGTTQSFDASAAAVIAVAGTAAQVSLPAAGLVVTATGAAASGTVTAEVTPIDPAANPGNMPGNYTARAAADGAVQTIESFGALSVTLKNGAGQALNLAAGKTATIRIPLATRSATPPATIPLFYFDETSGLWIEQGTAALAGTAGARYYEGSVAHFTYWNADQATNTIRVIGCVQDAAGQPVGGAEVSSYGSNYSGSDTVRSNPDCKFAVAILKGGIADVVARAGPRGSAPVRVGPSQVDIVLANPLVLSTAGMPPLIVEQPQSLTAPVDRLATFRVDAIGSGLLHFQWQRNGVDIAGQTTEYLVLGAAVGDNAALFRAVVSNAFGSATSDAAVLTVSTAPLPPLISGQPLPRFVQVGATATFEVAAVSQGGTLSYQWRRNGAPIGGATGTSYTAPAANAADNGAAFSVVVTSSNGTSTISNGAVLSVGAVTPVVIATQPANASVAAGQGASFSVTASGGTAALTYQWRRNGAAIAGAVAVSYTLTATTPADSGAVFSVVVSSGAESVTSGNATLTVTAPVGGNGYYLLASGGAIAAGSITFANGLQDTLAQALLGVDTAAPGNAPVTLEPAGQAGFQFDIGVEATYRGNEITRTRSRLATYFRNSRLYKVDQVVAAGAVPVPQLVSTLTTQQVCGTSGIPSRPTYADGNDYAAPNAGWVFLRGPGADGLCFTADDNHWAARLDMAATDPARSLAGEPQVAIGAADGAFAGVVILVGNQMRLLDAALGTAGTPLFTVDPASYVNLGHRFGSSLPGIWLFAEGGKLWGINLAAPATRVALGPLAAGEAASAIVAGDGGTAFVALSAANFSRVLRIEESLATPTTIVTITAPIDNIASTPTRVVLQLGGGTPQVVSVARAGGAVQLLTLFGAGVLPGAMVTSGENVYLPTYQLGATGASVSTLVIGADASNPVTWPNTDVKRGIAPVIVAANAPARTYAVVLADGVAALTSNAGATLRAVDGATRATLVTYGSLPTTPDGTLAPITLDPLQYGQSGLFTFIDSSSGVASLYYFRSDAAGLIRVPN